MRNTPEVSYRPRGRTARAMAIGLTAVLTGGLLAACSSSDDGGDGDQITLTVGVFGQFGYEEAGLYDEYMDLNPHIKIQQDSITENKDYIAQLLTRLSQGSGLADIQAIEVANIADMAGDLNARWVDFNEYEDVDTSHFAPWKLVQSTSADGRLIGLGTDIGPTAICYRKDHFEAAGLPTDREEVGALWAGDWSAYIETGEQFQENAPDGVSWVDSPGGVYNGVVSSYEERYYDAQGELIYEDSEAVQAAWELGVRTEESGLSTRQKQFTQEWDRAMANGDFATISCPAWMLGYIQEKAGDAAAGLWDAAPAPVPSNWGGAFVGVPEAGKNREEAVKLAAWLTAPEQQAKLFSERGSFPSSLEAQQESVVQEATHPYFEGMPMGEIFSAAAAEIPPTIIGPRDQRIQEAFADGLLQIAQQGESPEAAWNDTLSRIQNALDE